MRPKLKIGPLTQLQDARSSAAVGFDYLSFSLERGSMKKLSPEMVWNIVQWIQGPRIILDLNAASLEELVGISKAFEAELVSFPVREWDEDILKHTKAQIYLVAEEGMDPQHLSQVLTSIESSSTAAFVEIPLNSSHDFKPYMPLLPKAFLHFSTSGELITYVNSGNPQPYGFALGEEFREDAEYLDYEQIDDFIELLEELYPQG